MPKKQQPRNAYYFFMIDFREEQKKKGIVYQNLGEVQVAADPAWRQIQPGLRTKYENKAKAEKEKLRGSLDKKFTSNGVSLAEIDAQQQMLQEIQEQEIAEIRHFVEQKRLDHILLEEDIFLIDVNAYCFTGTHYYMAESTILRFSLLEGIKDTYHETINPGRIPIGYASDVKLGAIELGLDMPDEAKRSDYPKILAYLMDYIKQKAKGTSIPPLYTISEKVEQAQDFIRQLCTRSGEDESQMRVYKLEHLFFYMVNAIRDSPDEGYPKLTLAVAQLKKDPFKYTPGLACEHHEASDKAVECSKSRVQRWAYTVLDKCCPVAGVDPLPGRHVPRNLDIESVLAYKEHKKDLIGSCAASTVSASSYRPHRRDMAGSSATSMVGSYDPSEPRSVVDSNKAAPTRAPLRLPKTDYSKRMRDAPDLNLSESNFPTLRSGTGRGRGIARDLQNMSLNN